jgi:hypothetical protein
MRKNRKVLSAFFVLYPIERRRAGSDDPALEAGGTNYFFTISLPQHCKGTAQAGPEPEPQEQAFETRSSRPQVLHT